MAFEVFKRRNIPNRGVAVTVNKRGQLALSDAAHEAIGRPRYAALMFDRDSRTIGIQQCDNDTEGFMVTNSRLINAAAFVETFDIPHAHTVRRSAEIRDGILCVDVESEGVAVSSNRARTSR
ncbi:MAG: hypothetical protein L0I24_06880 [Pseudonocardia sp.]|nr:hypothetical protein [Pseudonocardia sp.]